MVERDDRGAVRGRVAILGACSAAAGQGRGNHCDGVVRGGRQRLEQVETAGVGDHVARGPGPVTQVDARRADRHRDAGHARLAGILHTVTVEVAPDEVADRSRGQHGGDVGGPGVVGRKAVHEPGVRDAGGVRHGGGHVARRFEHLEGHGDQPSAAGVKRPQVVPAQFPRSAVGGHRVGRRFRRDVLQARGIEDVQQRHGIERCVVEPPDFGVGRQAEADRVDVGVAAGVAVLVGLQSDGERRAVEIGPVPGSLVAGDVQHERAARRQRVAVVAEGVEQGAVRIDADVGRAFARIEHAREVVRQHQRDVGDRAVPRDRLVVGGHDPFRNVVEG